MQADVASDGAPKRTALTFLALGLILSFAFALVTPPFQVPDEGQHFFRAYQISEGRFIGETHQGAVGGWMPSALPNLVSRFLGTLAQHTIRQVQHIPFSATIDLLKLPLSETTREFVSFGAAGYSPLGYIPQAVAMALGRAAGLGPLYLMYIARLTNAVVSVLTVALALTLLPVGREMGLLFGLLPMSLTLYGSLSPDAAVISSGFLLGALVIRAQVTNSISSCRALGIVATATIIGSVKYVYLLMTTLTLPLLWRKPARDRASLVRLGLTIVMPLLASLIWFRLNVTAMAPDAKAAPYEQLQNLANSPESIFFVLGQTLAVEGVNYYYGAVGILGWLTIRLPSFVYKLAAAGILLCVLNGARDSRLPACLCILNVTVLAAIVISILLMMYIAWTPVNAAVVAGFQGRYMLPMAAVLAATLSSAGLRVRVLSGAAIRWVICTICIINAVTALAALLVQFGNWPWR